MDWPPKIGEVLSRPEDAWYEWRKIEDWIFGPAGHRSEWGTVFHIGLGDWELLWKRLTEVAIGAKINVVHDRRPYGFTCGITAELAINDRNAPVAISWHYLDKDSAPRLVTAYPTL